MNYLNFKIVLVVVGVLITGIVFVVMDVVMDKHVKYLQTRCDLEKTYQENNLYNYHMIHMLCADIRIIANSSYPSPPTYTELPTPSCDELNKLQKK